MNKRTIATFLIPVFLLSPVSQLGASENTTIPTPHESVRSTNGIQRVRVGNSEIETLTGPAAVAHLRNLQRKRAKAFDKAAQIMRERSFKPTDFVYVQRSVAADSSLRVSDSSISSPEGELVLWSWDDGDPYTWEGTVFMAAYGDHYAESLSNAQLDIASEATFDTTWEVLVDWYGDYRGPRDLDPVARRSTRRGDGGIQLISLRSSEYELLQSQPPQQPKPPMNPVKKWAICAGGACAGAAATCWITGPLFGACFNARCTGGSLACAVTLVLMEVWG